MFTDAHAESILEKFGVIKKGACVDSNNLEYVIVQKLDDHHYELRANNYGDEPYAYLETKQAIFDNVGHPLGIGMLHIGQKEMKLTNGFSQVFHLWRECRYNKDVAAQRTEEATIRQRKFLSETGWALPRRKVGDVVVEKKVVKGLTAYISKLGELGANEVALSVGEQSGDVLLIADGAGFKITIPEKDKEKVKDQLGEVLLQLKSANETYKKSKLEIPHKQFQIVGLGSQPVTGTVEVFDETIVERRSTRRITAYRLTAYIQSQGEDKSRLVTFREDQLNKLVDILKSKK